MPWASGECHSPRKSAEGLGMRLGTLFGVGWKGNQKEHQQRRAPDFNTFLEPRTGTTTKTGCHPKLISSGSSAWPDYGSSNQREPPSKQQKQRGPPGVCMRPHRCSPWPTWKSVDGSPLPHAFQNQHFSITREVGQQPWCLVLTALCVMVKASSRLLWCRLGGLSLIGGE